mgnify:FL=1
MAELGESPDAIKLEQIFRRDPRATRVRPRKHGWRHRESALRLVKDPARWTLARELAYRRIKQLRESQPDSDLRSVRPLANPFREGKGRAGVFCVIFCNISLKNLFCNLQNHHFA